MIGFAQTLRRVPDLGQRGIEIARRRADDPHDVGTRGLVLQCGVEIVEQLRIGDRDGGLVGKGLQHGRLLRIERSNLLAVEVEVADPFGTVEQRNADERPDVELRERGEPGHVVGHVVDQDRLAEIARHAACVQYAEFPTEQRPDAIAERCRDPEPVIADGVTLRIDTGRCVGIGVGARDA